jgi:hypothetical protein
MAWLPFVLSAALAAVSVRLAMRDPWSAALIAALVLALMIPTYLTRRRVRAVLRSGDVALVLRAWSDSFAKLPYPETMRPLITAAAFASCGWVEQARTALARSAKGPAWEAALEHRLFIETLLDTYEGHRDEALAKSSQLLALPLPAMGPVMQSRVRTLREALAAFARAFAHVSRAGDLELLDRASRKSPLVHWAMRYGAAVVAVDRGAVGRARRLLSGAPAWPEGCAFRDFQAELSEVVSGGRAAAETVQP